MTAVSIFAFVVGADRAGADYEAQRYDPGKQSKELELEQKIFSGEGGQRAKEVPTKLSDQAMQWVTRHRYQTVAGAWAASMAGSFAYGAWCRVS